MNLLMSTCLYSKLGLKLEREPHSGRFGSARVVVQQPQNDIRAQLKAARLSRLMQHFVPKALHKWKQYLLSFSQFGEENA